MASDQQTETAIDEIEDGIYRIFTPVDFPDAGGFSFNQYLIVDDEPLLFHTGLRKMFPATREAISRVMRPERLRWISFSHFEADECGALNEFLSVAPDAQPLCGQIAAMVSVNDYADKPARALADGETMSIGNHTVRWFDTPHLPHAWECGMLMETKSATLFCGDLFTQPGAEHAPVTDGDILGPSEAFRGALDYFSHARNTGAMIERLAAENPKMLACMHGSAWRGDGAAMLRSLAQSLEAS
jgi:flavorubredoxin